MSVFTLWDQEFSTDETNAVLQRLAQWHLGEIKNLATRELISNYVCAGDFLRLCDFDLSYEGISVLDAVHVRQILAFYQKRRDLDLGIDRKAVALEKFEAAELLCAETNAIFKAHAAGRFVFDPRVECVLHAAQRKIARVLGDVPSLETLQLRFGPGATTAVQKRNACPRNKLSAGIQCSEDLLPILSECLEEVPLWAGLDNSEPESLIEALARVDIVNAQLAFVPKNAKTDRSIGVEPVLNSMFQLGIGSYIADRLAAFGVDISDQSLNQRLAQYGSFTGEVATLDLSSASDTIATELVAHLLPVDWFLFLSRFRSRSVEYEGNVKKLQKFSSMGNGFTFPLETLIFWAIAASCCKRTDYLCNAYGDDIIVPADAAEDVIRALTAVGFLINSKKSFISGPFRESCGADYLSGINIRPCYIKGPLSGATAFILHNFYVRSGLPEAAAIVLDVIDAPLRKWGPDGYGDGHLLGDWSAKPIRRNGYGGFTFETFTYKTRRSFELRRCADKVLPAYAIYSRGTEGLSSGADFLPSRDWDSFKYCIEGAFIYDKQGRLGTTLPGRSDVKLLSVYTFDAG